MNVFKELYNYRELLKTNIKKEIRGKYKGSWLGVVWTFLNPLLMLAVYAFVFPYILRVEVENYTIFMIVALIPWSYFTTAVISGTSCININGVILKKVYFPREIIPLSVTISQLINFLITCIIMMIFILVSGVGFTWHFLLFPVIVFIEFILILGINFILSSITVFVNDIAHFVQIAMTLGFYATPIVYLSSMLPEKFQWAMHANPMAVLVESYRAVLYYHQLPDMTWLGIWAALSFAILILGYLLFKKLEKTFVEEL